LSLEGLTMGMRWWRTNACERAMQWISLELDGELSQLERAALGRHLDACDRCRAVSADVGAFTSLLRDAPPVELRRPLVLPAPRPTRAQVARRAAASLAFAALIAVAVFGGVVLTARTTSARSAFTFRN